MQVGTCGGRGEGAVVSTCMQPRVADPLRLDPHSIGAPGSLGWAALSILEPSTIKKKPSSPASWESTCGEEGGRRAERVHARHAFLARELGEYLRGRDRHLARAHNSPSQSITGHQRSSEAIRGNQRPSEAISGHQSSESTCTAEIAISLKLGTWDAISGHLRSISHGMFDSLKRPSSGLVLRFVTAAPSAVASSSSRVSTYS